MAVSGQLVVTAPWDGNLWLVAGGIFYTAGLAFFFSDDRRFNHAIWHLFVLAGSICHYRAVVIYLTLSRRREPGPSKLANGGTRACCSRRRYGSSSTRRRSSPGRSPGSRWRPS